MPLATPEAFNFWCAAVQGLQDPASNSFNEAAGLISELHKAPENAALTTQRSLSLAAVELERRRSSCHESSCSTSAASAHDGGDAASSSSLSAAVLEHFKRFGHLASCATDLK